MPFIARADASRAYDSFVQKGLPDHGREFEMALVKILFKEMAGAERVSVLFLDYTEYQSYKMFASRSKTN
jgi:hypothetical protein